MLQQVERTLIEELAGIKAGSAIATIYARRDISRAQAELSYRLLLHPDVAGPVTVPERHVIAAFVASLYDEGATKKHYLDLLQKSLPHIASVISDIAQVASGKGPWGNYPAGPLSAENTAGIVWRATPQQGADLGPKQVAALEHAHLLVTHPRDADNAALQRLTLAGWDEDAIVIISQLISFVSFQVRVVSGFSALVSSYAKRQAVGENHE